MESLEFNKLAGGFLGACLSVMALGLFSDVLFSRERPEKPGYDLPVPVEAAAAGGAAAPQAAPFAEMMAKADVKKGEANAKVCTTCHSFGGAPKPTGPNLEGVVGRKKGSTDFAYSDGMKAKGGDWTYADLNEFITNPKGYVPGTKMGFAGERDPVKRADIIDYLRSVTPNPPPLPTVAAAEPAPPPATPTGAPGGAGAKPAPASVGGVAPAPKPAPPAPTAAPSGTPEHPTDHPTEATGKQPEAPASGSGL